MSLKKYSTDELQKELIRRKKGDLPLKDYYFTEDEDDEDEGERFTFLIIHKRRWHLEHCSDDGAYDYLIKERLPEGFINIQESVFEYKPAHLRKKGEKPKKKDAVKALKEAGAGQIKKPWQDLSLTYIVSGDEKIRFTIEVDDLETKKVITEMVDKNPALLENIHTFTEHLKGWTDGNAKHTEFESSNSIVKMAIVPKKIWKKLPEFPGEEE